MRRHMLLLVLAGCFHAPTEQATGGGNGAAGGSTAGGASATGGGSTAGGATAGGSATAGGATAGGGSGTAGGSTAGPSKWFRESVPPGGGRNLLDVWALGLGEVWVVGSHNRILHREFNGWQTVPTPMSADVDYVSVTMSGGQPQIATSLSLTFTLLGGGTSLRLEPVPLLPGERLRALAPELVVGGATGAASAGAAFELGADGGWARVSSPPAWSELTGVWGLGGAAGIAVDDSGRLWVRHFGVFPFSRLGTSQAQGGSGGVWGEIAPNDDVLYAATGTDGRLYAGSGGTLVGHGSGPVLRSVWGSSLTDLWAVGDNGRIAHFDGTTLTDVPSGVTTTLRSVHGTGPNDVWAVGDDDVVLHYTGPDGCQSDTDCSGGSKCCYPCGIPGCSNRCTAVMNNMCPLVP